MVQERHLTPEKQLLNLIESPKAKETAALGLHTIKNRSLSLLSPQAWLGRISFSKDWFKNWLRDSSHRQLDIKAINAFLGLCIVLLIVYFISNILVSAVHLRKTPELASEPAKTAKGDGFQEGALLKNAVSYYLEQIRQRDIFRMGKKTAEDTAGPEPAGPSGEIIEATAHLKLVGISWSGDPDAMIEDTKALKTFFAKRGQMIGDVRVRAIFKDKVILQYRGEEIELR